MNPTSVDYNISTDDMFGAHIVSGVLGTIEGREIGPGHVILTEARYAMIIQCYRDREAEMGLDKEKP